MAHLDHLASLQTMLGAGASGASGSRGNFSLNSAYVHNTSGQGLGISYMSPTTDTIDELYIFLDTITGTRANITMGCDIYNENTVSRPGTTVRDSYTAVAMPSADDMWIKFTFGTPYTPAIGEVLWFVFYNLAASPTVDYPQIMNVTNLGLAFGASSWVAPYQTTNGFSGSGTAVTELPFVVKQGSYYYGQPFTQFNNAYYTSNTRRRGMQVTPLIDVSVTGMVFPGNTAYSKIEVYDNVTAPGGTALYSYNLDADANLTTADARGARRWSPFTLYKNTTYKIVLTYGTSNAFPGVLQIEDYSSFSSMFDSMRAENLMFMPYSCIDDGASGWTIEKNITPGIGLLVADFPPSRTPIYRIGL